ncbi:MAG: sodium:proton antiporter [Chthonomonadales bacterium]
MTSTLDQITLLLMLSVLIAMVARRLKLPYTVGLMAAGIGLTALGLNPEVRLTRELLFSVFLPPLIFESAYHIKWSELAARLTPVLTMATVGVGIAASLVAVGMHYLVGWGWGASWLFAVLIAATDPVSVIATFKDARVTGEPRLMVEAESLFNDATAAVAYAIVIAAVSGKSVSIGANLMSFGVSVGGGLAIGGLVGALTLFLAGRQDEKLLDITLTMVAAYASFWIAERFHVSGVLATLTAGLMVGNLGELGHLSDSSREAVVSFWEVATFMVNSLVFLLIGFSVLHQRLPGIAQAIGVAILLVLIGRAAAVYGCCAVFRTPKSKVSFPLQHVLFWGGLRGALGLALALGIPNQLPYATTVRAVTFFVVAFSIIVQGLTMTPLLKKLGFVAEPEKAAHG